jgi:membrane protease YdiL (CAAX protease family)
MNDFFAYIRNPGYCASKKPALIILILLFIIYIFSAISIGIFREILTKHFQIVQRVPDVAAHPGQLFLVILLGPVTEEILFRSWLRFTKVNAVLFGAVLGFIFMHATIGRNILAAMVSFVVLSGLVGSLIVTSVQRIETFLSGHFPFFFYFSAIAFGLVHASNFTGNPHLILLFSPLLGGPQIVFGVILGYVRMNHGLRWSMLFHMFVNMSVLLQFL